MFIFQNIISLIIVKIFIHYQIYDLSNKYINKDNQYINNIKFDKDKFKNTYILSFDSKGSTMKDFVFCKKNKCDNSNSYSNNNKPLKYEGDTHIYMLNPNHFKIINKMFYFFALGNMSFTGKFLPKGKTIP